MKLKIEIADTPELLAQGLMGRQKLSEDCGMLFKFHNALPLSFWGKNTYIPLDIAFIDQDHIVDIKEIVPLSTKTVKSNQSCAMALETNLGFFKKNGIGIGHRIKIHDREIEFVQ